MVIDRPSTYLTSNGAGTATPWREALGYDPFRRFFSNLDPEIDVVRTENGFDVEIPVAGYKPEQIDITIKDDVMTVAGKSDRRAFTRALKLPGDVDATTIEARVEHGMLSLRLQRYPEAKPRKIEIKTAPN